ncbi:MAG: helix-turn-helix domain-containing protein [Candidatus Methanoperedens sp.]|nr:helix-turn-helix domain-containing protein [Candidatus Methanoperedens sp.]
MVKEKETFEKEILEIKSELSDIHADLKRFFEQSNRLHHESVLSGIQRDFSNVIIGHVTEDIEDGLDRNMIRNCEMRDSCKSIFTGFLQKNTSLIKQSNVDEGIISKNRSELREMKNNAPKKQCDKCFLEVSNLFGKQLLLMRSLRIYDTNDENKKDITVIPEELIVNDILEPLSNMQRIQILKAVSAETKTFSDFCALTGLRGGNLLFHLQKLLDSGMILQRHERGDYMITDKGYKALKGISDIYLTLKS